MASKSCAPTKMRENSDEEVNQEVPANCVEKLHEQCHLVPVEQPWQPFITSLPNQSLPTAKVSKEFNWQATQLTVRERNAVMFNNNLMADIHFTVGSGLQKQTLPAHKYVLATGSSVFHAMFFGGLADGRDGVEIPDVEPAAFFNLLRYLYCDDIQLEPDNVLTTLYVSKKYLVPSLAKACVRYLETSLSARNACILLSQGRLFEEQELMQHCWQVIDAQAEEALQSDRFKEIDHSTLETVLGRETLNAKELFVFNAACDWAERECFRRGIEATSDNKRHVLGSLLYLIRIPNMNLEDFANGPAQSGVLTLQETTDIFLHYTARHKPKLPFKHKPRTGLHPQRCHRFHSSAYRSNQWRYRGRCDSIQFSVSKRIFVAGFGLYGSSNGSAEYQMKMELKKEGTVLGQNLTRFISDGSSNTFQVMFDNPIQIDPDIFYTASIVLEGTELSYFGQEGMAEVQCENVNFQLQCSADSTNGTGVQGGQIPEIIFYS